MPAYAAGKPLVAMIPLAKGTFPDIGAVTDALAQRHSDEPAPAEAARGPDSAVFRWGAGPVAVALKSEPVPDEEIADACEAAWWWEEAGEKLAQQQAHLLVSLAPSSEDPLDRHLRLSRVVAAIVNHSAALAVYWPNAGIVHEPQSFAEQAAASTRDDFNPALWIDLRISPSDDETWALDTTGMGAFGRLEIEIPQTTHDPSEVYELCAGIIRYLLASGEEIADGGAISRSDEEQIDVRYGPSMFDEQQTVMQLEF